MMKRISQRTSPTTESKAFTTLIKRLRHYPGALIPLLQQTQGIFGYLPEDAIREIARALDLSPSQVYGVVTFYSQFRLHPVGRNIIKVCHGTACHVAGAETITEGLERALAIHTGETTGDGSFTLEKVACLGCCSLAPVIMINSTVHGKVRPDGLTALLEKYK